MKLRSKKIAKFLAALLAIQFVGFTSSFGASNPRSLTASRVESSGIINISWSAPSDTSNLTGYKVIVDSSGSGKNVSQLVNVTTITSAKICFPFTGQTKVFVASVTSTNTNPTLANSRSPESYWTVFDLGALGSVSASTACTTNTTAYSYSIAFDKNNASATGSMATISGSAFAVVLPSNSFTLASNSFSGWSRTNSGAKQYNNGVSVTLDNTWASATLFAVWVASSGYDIYYEADGGTGTDPSTPDSVTAGGTFVAPSNPYTKTGYTFKWWSTGTETITAGGTSSAINAPVTLTAVWEPDNNLITYAPGGGSGTGPSTPDSVTSGSTFTVPSNTFTREGYTFAGWSDGTNTYSAGDTYPSSGSITGAITLTAQWTANSSPAPAPVYVPHPPTITSISAAEVCAITPQLVIKGTWLTGATAKVDGVAAQVLATSQNEMTVVLPSAPVGTKTITVTNADGSATTTVKYAFADTPIYVDYIYPETFKDRFFSYIFKALDAVKYEISGTMPAGLTLNSTTGELSGAPTQEGNFVFQIIASNICASTPLIVYMFVDKAIPTAFTCSVAFNVPSSNNITEAKLTNLRNCLSKTSTLSPKYINPVIFISGGLPAGLTSDQALTHPRYLPILDVIVSMNLNAQIYYGAFNGSTDSVQLNVYWPDPS